MQVIKMVFTKKSFEGISMDKSNYLLPDSKITNSYRSTLFRNLLLSIFVLFVSSFCIFYFLNTAILYLNQNVPMCRDIPDIEKVDCFPDSPVTEAQCIARGCCFSVPKAFNSNVTLPPLNIPYCYYPSNYKGYVVTDIKLLTATEINASLKLVKPSGFPKDIANLKLIIKFIDDYMLRIKISDQNSRRYEVPIGLQYQTKDPERIIPTCDVTLDPQTGLLEVRRSSTGSKIFSTNLSLLVFSDQFLQLTSSLPTPYFYGIGEHYSKLARNVNWTRFTLINSDLPPVPNHGLYGSHPFYMALEGDGKASGVFLFNSNIMDVILQPAPAVTFRPIGGIFDFYIMLGPSPKDVSRQYSDIVGKTFMPPFWSLGFQLCRFGYKTLNKTREVMQRNIDAGIPLDVQWNDIDYMDNYKDFTYDKVNFADLPQFVNDLHASGRHYVIMTDPGLSNSEKVYAPYDEGLDDDLFIKNSNGSIFVGKVWTSGTTVFPDFSHPAAVPFWTRQFRKFYNEVNFDGVWIDMNEPSNFYDGQVDGCPDSSLETPQYVPGGNPLKTKTVCMSAKQYLTTHYNMHNIYGYQEAVATYEALKNVRRKRPFIISRATFPGQGVYSGHWSGDIASTWEDMRYTIPSMINFNMYGIPMVGSDICGFNGNTTVELCARWQSLGAFYPFSRNHNERITIEQDPAALGITVEQATIKALFKRYALLPYLYTLFYRSHAFGDTVVRPLFFEFPEDINTFNKDEQFLWGSAIMIVPCLYPNTTTVSAYFPKELWYHESGKEIKSSGETISLDISLTDIFVYFRGGSIIPAFPVKLSFPKPEPITTTLLRNSSFYLMVFLDEQQAAFGELYWDDGESLETYENGLYSLIKFESHSGSLNNSIVHSGYQTNIDLEEVTVLGLKEIPKQVKINGKDCKPLTLNASVNSTIDEEHPTRKNIKSILFKDEYDEQVSNDDECTFFYIQNIIVINFAPISMLSPFQITWN